MLVGLGGKTPCQAEIAAFPAIPGCPHGVGAILDQHQIVFLDDVGEALHVGQMTAHVRQQQETRPGCLCLALEILKIDHQVLGDFDQQRFSAGGGDGAGYGRKREAVGQNRFTMRKTCRTQGNRHGISA